MRMVVRGVGLALSVGLVAAACSAAPAASPSGGVASPSGAPASAGGDTVCAKEDLAVKTPGQLTIGTDNPAFEPWFAGGTPEGSEWEINDPSTGEGYESAVAYAVAEKLGFTEDEVTWVVVPFAQAYAPGEKTFDFALNQISITPERAEAVDFSEGYYDVNQAVVAVADTPAAEASSIEDLKGVLFGAQVGTTSYDYVVENVQPDQEPRVYDSNDAAIQALEAGQIEALVVDLPTAFFVTAAQMENGTIVGQFPPVGEQEQFGLVLEKDSPLTDCVDQAITALRADGTLDEIREEWLQNPDQPPVLE